MFQVYRDFFRLNSLYDFQRLSETCTFFRGCPINRLDVSIAYDLPELVGKYKKQAEKVLEQVADKKSKSWASVRASIHNPALRCTSPLTVPF